MMVVDSDQINGSYESTRSGHQRRHEPVACAYVPSRDSLPTTTPTSGGIRSCKGDSLSWGQFTWHLQRHRLASRLYLALISGLLHLDLLPYRRLEPASAAMATQHRPGAGARSASTPVARRPLSTPCTSAWFMLHTKSGCCSTRAWNGQLRR